MRLIRFRSPSISSLHSSAALPSPYIARSARSYHHQRRGQRPRAVAALLPAARHQRLEADARLAADVQRADALGAVALVARDGHQVDVHRVHVHEHLGAVGVEVDAVLAADGADLFERLDHADFVVDAHDGDETGLVCDRVF